MIYTKNDFTEGTIFENPYEKDQMLRVHVRYPTHFVAWTTKEPHERWWMRYEEIKRIRRVINQKSI